VNIKRLHSKGLLNDPLRKKRLLIDVSHIAKFDHRTGIQRVVREIVKALYKCKSNAYEVIAIEMNSGAIRRASEWLQTLECIDSNDKFQRNEKAELSLQNDDILLMIDSSWEKWEKYDSILSTAKKNHVKIFTVIYDILMLNLPSGNFGAGSKGWFEKWLMKAITISDGLVCISHATAKELKKYISTNISKSIRPPIGYWHLGSDFSRNNRVVIDNNILGSLKQKSFLLMVGTIEPRKNHALALEIMEYLWDRGNEICLCIAGKKGWMVDELVEKIKMHKMIGNKLFYYDELDDGYLTLLYKKAEGLLLLSKGEGFGLPLVEAANHGTPIICSDLPVFREIAGDFATYMPLNGVIQIAKKLEVWQKRKDNGELPDTAAMPRLSWDQSAEALINVLLDQKWMT